MRSITIVLVLLAGLGAAWWLLAGNDNELHESHGIAASVESDAKASATDAALSVQQPTAIPAVAYDGRDDVMPEEAAPSINGVEVRGKLVDADGKPLGGEKIMLTRRCELYERIATEQRETTTNTDGLFSLKGIPVGAVASVRASPMAAQDVTSEEFAVPAKGLDVGVLKAPRGESVNGFVRTPGGLGVAGLRVVASPKAETGFPVDAIIVTGGALAGQRAAMSNADGAFRIQGLKRGTVQLRTREVGALAEAQCETEAGPSQEPVTLVLPAGGEIRGIVTDNSGQPLADAQVMLRSGLRNATESVIGFEFDRSWGAGSKGRCTTDAQGKFVVRAFNTGMKPRARVSKPGFVTTEQDLEGNDCTIRLKRTGVLYGTVKDASDTAPLTDLKVAHRETQWVRSSQGSPRVLYGKEAAATAGIPECDGLYALVDVQPSKFSLRANASGHVGILYENMTMEAEGLQRQDIVLDRAAVIEGVVLDPFGQPSPGAEVTADNRVMEQSIEMSGNTRIASQLSGEKPEMKVSNEKQFRHTQSDAAGQFRFEGLCDGNYKLQASHGEHASTPLFEVRVEKATNPPSVKLQLAVGGTIEGIALDADGRGQQFVTVSLAVHVEKQPGVFMHRSGKSGNRETLCDKEGRFRMSGLPPGTWDVSLAPNGQQHTRFVFGGIDPQGVTVTCDVREGEVTKVELREAALGSVEGVVRCAGKPVPDVKMELNRKREGENEESHFIGFLGFGGEQVKTDSEGRFRFDKRKAGNYEVVAWPTGAAESVSQEVVVAERGTARAELDLPGAAIQGRVVSKSTRMPIAGVVVKSQLQRPEHESPRESSSMVFAISTRSEDGDAMMLSFGGAESVRTDSDGNFMVRFLKPGKYTLNFEGAGIIEGKLKDIDVAPEALRSGVMYEAEQGASLVVKLSGSKAAALDLVQVVATHIQSGTAHTEHIGGRAKITFRALQPGRYKVTISDPENGGESSKEIEVSLGRETVLDMEL
ncbi:MAG: hypothetical protein EXS14_07310 [Planctomycetes bacterium]|nr:hypothetical protein [Planctomycetota bacterium]